MKKIFLFLAIAFTFVIPAIGQPTPNQTARRIIQFANDTAAGTCNSARKSFVYYNTTTNVKRWCNGTTWNDEGGGSLVADGMTFSAGTTARAPINLTAGTNLTTPAAGSIEYDGKVFYGDVGASQRTVIGTQQFVSNTSDTTLTNGTAAQSVFASANDVLTVVGSTSYFFEAEYFLTTGATTHTTATLFGGTATLTSANYWAELWSVTDGTISTTAPSVLRVAVGTSTVLNATSIATATTIRIRGIIRVNAAGTLIPQIAFSADPTGTLLGKTNSYFRLWPIGTNTITNVGPWN
jgi:hypothetical protein